MTIFQNSRWLNVAATAVYGAVAVTIFLGGCIAKGDAPLNAANAATDAPLKRLTAPIYFGEPQAPRFGDVMYFGNEYADEEKELAKQPTHPVTPTF